MKINLKFWQSGSLLTRLAGCLGQEFDSVLDAVESLKTMNDPESCPEEILELIAWQRGVDRLPGEDVKLFRLRVKHAFQNALDAGSKKGFELIWRRLGLGEIIQTERPDQTDNRDVILIALDDAKFAPYRGLFDTLVRTYGRTCRRYRIVDSDEPAPLGVRPFVFSCDNDYFKAVHNAE